MIKPKPIVVHSGEPTGKTASPLPSRSILVRSRRRVRACSAQLSKGPCRRAAREAVRARPVASDRAGGYRERQAQRHTHASPCRHSPDRAGRRIHLVAERRPLRDDGQFLRRRAEGSHHPAGHGRNRRRACDRGTEGQGRRSAVRHRSAALPDRPRSRERSGCSGGGRFRQPQVLVRQQPGPDQNGRGYRDGPDVRFQSQDRSCFARRRHVCRSRHRDCRSSSRRSRSSNSSGRCRRPPRSSSAAT